MNSTLLYNLNLKGNSHIKSVDTLLEEDDVVNHPKEISNSLNLTYCNLNELHQFSCVKNGTRLAVKEKENEQHRRSNTLESIYQR